MAILPPLLKAARTCLFLVKPQPKITLGFRITKEHRTGTWIESLSLSGTLTCYSPLAKASFLVDKRTFLKAPSPIRRTPSCFTSPSLCSFHNGTFLPPLTTPPTTSSCPFYYAALHVAVLLYTTAPSSFLPSLTTHTRHLPPLSFISFDAATPSKTPSSSPSPSGSFCYAQTSDKRPSSSSLLLLLLRCLWTLHLVKTKLDNKNLQHKTWQLTVQM